MKSIPKVLVGCPTYGGHGFCIKRFLTSLKEIRYPDFDVLFVDNSEKEDHANLIKSQGYEVIRNKEKTDDKVHAIIQNRNILIKRVLEKDYDYLLFLDTDVLAPERVIEKLVSHNKDIVSGVCPGRQKIKGRSLIAPVIYDFADKEGYVKPIPINKILEDTFFEIAACGFGCCLIKKEVLQKINLRYNKELGGGEDFPFCKDAREKGYKIFADTSIRCTHMHADKDLEFPISVAGFGIRYDIK